MFRKILDIFVWVMFFGLLALGGIIYATDRTYPGDKLYPFKLKFEDFAMATSKILNKQVDYSMTLVVKRSNELDKILSSKHSKEGLARFNNQVESTADSILSISDPVEKKVAAQKYIAKLNEVSVNLNEQHQTITNKQTSFQQENTANNNQPNNYLQPTDVTNPTQPVVNQPTTSTTNEQTNPTQPLIEPTNSQTEVYQPSSTEVIQNLENSQEIVQQTINEMTEIADQGETVNEGRGNSEENRRNDVNQNNGNNRGNER